MQNTNTMCYMPKCGPAVIGLGVVERHLLWLIVRNISGFMAPSRGKEALRV